MFNVQHFFFGGTKIICRVVVRGCLYARVRVGRVGDEGARTTTLEDTLFRLSKLRERLKAMLRSPAHLIGHGPGAGGGGVVGLHSHASSPPHARPSLFDSCHRKIRLIGGGPVAFLGGLVA
uniref:Uncharacterized protein n=1 Tax=Anopheles coluzzii TaxID=1518534 RepID=A0A8W7P9M7_ANOCL